MEIKPLLNEFTIKSKGIVPLYPYLMQSQLHVKVWGGRRLAEVMGRELPDEQNYGESWELHDSCVIDNGILKGTTLGEIVQRYDSDIIGQGYNPAEGMPLLVKLLDAEQWLSVQVHPDDEQARELEHEPRGKSEAWVVLEAAPDAQLVIGVTPGTTREQMAEAIRDARLEDYLVYERVQSGDVLYIPANTIHAIGPGLLIYEIQQSSDTTYRLYDWGRVGLDGKPRELHIDKGTEVADLDELTVVTHPQGQHLLGNEYFDTHRLVVESVHRMRTQSVFHAITCLRGYVVVTANRASCTLATGRTALIPAGVDTYALDGEGVVLVSHPAVR